MSNSSASPSAPPSSAKKKEFRFNEEVKTRPIPYPYMKLKDKWDYNIRWYYDKNPNYTDVFVPGKHVGENFTTLLRGPGPNILPREQIIKLYDNTTPAYTPHNKFKGIGSLTRSALIPAGKSIHDMNIGAIVVDHDDPRYENVLHRNISGAKESKAYRKALASSIGPAEFKGETLKGEIINDEEANRVNIETNMYPLPGSSAATLADAYDATGNINRNLERNLEREREREKRKNKHMSVLFRTTPSTHLPLFKEGGHRRKQTRRQKKNKKAKTKSRRTTRK